MLSAEKDEGNMYSRLAAVFFIMLAIPLLQYFFRRFDDNAIASWYLVSLTTSFRNFFLFLIPGALLAFSAARISLPLSRPLFLFSACFAATVLFWSSPELNTVSARYVTQAKHLELYGPGYFFREWGNSIQAWMDLPAVPFFNGLIFTVFGESRLPIQLFTAFVFGMTSVVTYLIGKTLWDEETGFYGGLLLLGIPYLIIQTPLMLLDVHTMFFLTLAIFLYIRALDAGGAGREAAAAFAIFIASFCKYSVWPMLSILPVISAVFYFGKRNLHERIEGNIADSESGRVVHGTVRIFLLSLVLVGIPVLLMFDVVVAQIKLMMSFLRPSLGRWTEPWASVYLFQIHPVITIAAAASIALAAWKRDRNYLILVWLPFLAVLFEIKRVRYILPAFPMLTLMSARGLVELRNRDLKKVIVSAVVITSLATGFFLFLPFFKQWSTVNLRDAGRFLDTLDVDAVDVIAVPQQQYPVNPAVAVPMLDLFTHKKIIYQYVPGASTPDEDFHTSRFRDSWEYINPPYYRTGVEKAGKKAVAVILADVQEKIPPETMERISNLHHTRSFTTYYLFFQNHTIVRIYW